MIKSLFRLSDSVKYYSKKSRGKIGLFSKNFRLILPMLGWILQNLRAIAEVPETKRARRASRLVRKRTSLDCNLYAPARAKFFE